MGTIATDMLTLSKLHSTNATKRAKTIPQRFFWPCSVMSKRTSSATVSTSTGPPPPALGTTTVARLTATGAGRATAAIVEIPMRTADLPGI